MNRIYAKMVMKKNRLKNRGGENEIFLVEKILDKRIRDNGQEEFLLKWKGFSEYTSTHTHIYFEILNLEF